jgi:D-serine deaminase-like pyridoxal phosphate-dependent protein
MDADAAPPANLWDLDTPVLVVDLDRLERNLDRMADRCRQAGVRLRPHTKAHKTPQIAALQVAHGAQGLSVAKVGEAEVMAAAGFDNLFVVYPILGEQKYRRLLPLMEQADVRIGLDSLEVASVASEFFHAHGRRLKVLLEVDSGFGRCGVQSLDEAVTLADRMGELPGIELVGVMGFGGQAYRAPDLAAVAAIGQHEGVQATDVAAALRARGHTGVRDVSVGSSPSARHAIEVGGVTEVRPGVFIFNDCKQVSLGVAAFDDCALTVLSTVVSRPRGDRLILDAGIKALAGEDYGWGTYGRLLDSTSTLVSWAAEEHGIIDIGPRNPDPGVRIRDKVRIIPNHGCGAVNMHDVIYAVRGECVEAAWLVAAPGKLR